MKMLKKCLSLFMAAVMAVSSLCVGSVTAAAADLSDMRLISVPVSSVNSDCSNCIYVGNDLYMFYDTTNKKNYLYRIDSDVILNWKKTEKLNPVKISVDSAITKTGDWRFFADTDLTYGNYGVVYYYDSKEVRHLIVVKYDKSKKKLSKIYENSGNVSIGVSPDGGIFETTSNSSGSKITLTVRNSSGKEVKSYTYSAGSNTYVRARVPVYGNKYAAVASFKYDPDTEKLSNGYIDLIDKNGTKTRHRDKVYANVTHIGGNYLGYSVDNLEGLCEVYSFDRKIKYDIANLYNWWDKYDKCYYYIQDLGPRIYGSKAVAAYTTGDTDYIDYVLIDLSGAKFISEMYSDIESKDNGKTYVAHEWDVNYSDGSQSIGKYVFLDSSGKEIRKFDDAGPFYGDDKYAPVVDNNRVYLVNRNIGQATYPISFNTTAHVWSMSEGVYKYSNNSKYYLFTYQDNTTATYDNMKSLKISSVSDKIYKGSPITPDVVIKDGTKTLTKGADYKLTYENNDGVGVATIRINGQGKYSGVRTITFKILPAQSKFTSAKRSGTKVTLKWREVKGIDKYQIYYSTDGGKTFKKATNVNGKKTSTTITVQKDKNYVFKIRAYKEVDEKKYYGSWSKTVTLKK